MKKHGLWVAAAALVLASGASAQSNSDGWLAWLGCWRAVGAIDNQLLCVVPEGAGVKLLGIADGQIKNETRVIADNTARQASQEGCAGTERAVWSNDQRRVFLRADQVCGEQTKRDVTGMLALVKADEMISVQSVTAYENTTVRTVRYKYVESANVPASVTSALAANRLARETARTAASAKIDLDDVKEAVAKVHPEVVQSWLSAAEQPFKLDGKTLVALKKDGVPAGVLDVLVAVSNPKYFALKPAAEVATTANTRDTDRDRRYGRASCMDTRFSDPWLDPWGYSFYGYGYDRCRPYYGYGYGYSPYSGLYSPYYNAWRFGTPVIVVRGSDEDAGGKVTRRGYSRGSSPSESGSGATYSRPPSSSGSSSGMSSGSSSSGGDTSSGSTGRTAKPRGGN